MSALLPRETVRVFAGRILVVTGARSHADAEDAQARRLWCADIVLRAILDQGITTLVVGDARGPDVWAMAVALSLGLQVIVYEAQTGLAVVVDGDSWAHEVKPWGRVDHLTATVRPIERNAVMVRHAATRDPAAVVLGFLDPSPSRKTRGTERTLALAVKHELVPINYAWGEPVE